MKLDNRKLYELLKDKGVTNLYHANTVATSITFIEEGGLLSREYVENKELYQTLQTSDEIDKLFDVFDDIFLDTTDLHKHFCRQNHYGPVLFQFSLELLLDDEFEYGGQRITQFTGLKTLMCQIIILRVSKSFLRNGATTKYREKCLQLKSRVNQFFLTI